MAPSMNPAFAKRLALLVAIFEYGAKFAEAAAHKGFDGIPRTPVLHLASC